MNIFELTTEELKMLEGKQFKKLYPKKKQMKTFQKHLFFIAEEIELFYRSMEQVWLDYCLDGDSPISFNDFVFKLENSEEGVPSLCDGVGHAVSLISEHCHGETEFPYFKDKVYTVLDSHVDYKRGHEVILEIFELDYKALGMEKPKKKTGEYFGITYTRYQDGDMYDYEGLRPFKLVKKKITVEEWKEC